MEASPIYRMSSTSQSSKVRVGGFCHITSSESVSRIAPSSTRKAHMGKRSRTRIRWRSCRSRSMKAVAPDVWRSDNSVDCTQHPTDNQRKTATLKLRGYGQLRQIIYRQGYKKSGISPRPTRHCDLLVE